MVKPVTKINVIPNLPEPLRRLQELAFNMRWAWDHETFTLFRRLERELWDATGHNPVLMLGQISQDKFTLNLNDYTRGIYIYHLVDATGKIIESGKFQVSR